MQVARYEQTNGDRDQVAGNHAACKQQGSIGRENKAEIFRLIGNWVIGSEQKTKTVGKGGDLLCPNVTFCSL